MSLGIGGMFKKAAEDGDCAIYEYAAYNLDNPQRENIFDGVILIDKNCLIEPEIRDKIRRTPSGKRKSFRKIIPREIPLDELIKSGEIQIENCSRAWNFLPNGTDLIAYRLCSFIFKRYQENGALPFSGGIHM